MIEIGQYIEYPLLNIRLENLGGSGANLVASSIV